MLPLQITPPENADSVVFTLYDPRENRSPWKCRQGRIYPLSPRKITPPENADRVEFTLYAPPENRSP